MTPSAYLDVDKIQKCEQLVGLSKPIRVDCNPRRCPPDDDSSRVLLQRVPDRILRTRAVDRSRNQSCTLMAPC